jgi:hypothetical protein
VLVHRKLPAGLAAEILDIDLSYLCGLVRNMKLADT